MQARGKRFDRNVLWVNENSADPFWVKNLDAMLAGQALGLNVVNGYSGLLPNGYPLDMALLKGDCCNDLCVWAGMHPRTIGNNSLIEIGPSCHIPDYEFLPIPIKGFSAVEVAKEIHVWAIDKFAALQLPENTGKQEEEILSFDLATLIGRSVKITGPDGGEQIINLVPGHWQHVEIQFSGPKEKGIIRFQTDTDGVKPVGESRTLFFDVGHLAERPLPPAH